MMDGTLFISNCALGDETFDSDRGSWNVSSARRDCHAGKHGEAYLIDIPEAVAASAKIDADDSKIAAMIFNRRGLETSPPLIFVEDGRAEDGRSVIWLIDGVHRLRALHRLGHSTCLGFVIGETEAERYRILYNGRRVAPWMETHGKKIEG